MVYDNAGLLQTFQFQFEIKNHILVYIFEIFFYFTFFLFYIFNFRFQFILNISCIYLFFKIFSFLFNPKLYLFLFIYFFFNFLHLCTDIFVEITMITMGHHTQALVYILHLIHAGLDIGHCYARLFFNFCTNFISRLRSEKEDYNPLACIIRREPPHMTLSQ